MIAIDFLAGSHGNFLEIVLNGIYHNVEMDALNRLGASHLKDSRYKSSRHFIADHFSFGGASHDARPLLEFEAVISITVADEDIPRLQLNCWHRGGNANVRLDDPADLNRILREVNEGTPPAKQQVRIDLYENLRSWKHDGYLVDKNCVREMIKLGYYPELNGLMQKQQKLNYSLGIKLIRFPFAAFYDWEHFSNSLRRILDELNMQDRIIPEFVQRQFNRFRNKNVFKDITILPTKYFDLLKLGEDAIIENMNIYQEAYLDYLCERYFGIKALFAHENCEYFRTTGEILDFIRQTRNDRA